ncbi:MAG: hypothetical protein ACREBS_05100 [Nitrososphaerales archaeon]
MLSRCHSILLDLRDYGKKDTRAMNTDLTEIQNLWQAINEHFYREQQKEGGVDSICNCSLPQTTSTNVELPIRTFQGFNG